MAVSKYRLKWWKSYFKGQAFAETFAAGSEGKDGFSLALNNLNSEFLSMQRVISLQQVML